MGKPLRERSLMIFVPQLIHYMTSGQKGLPFPKIMRKLRLGKMRTVFKKIPKREEKTLSLVPFHKVKGFHS